MQYSIRPMVVVDSHNKVLKAWSECRRELPLAPRLLTLDHHTDTSRPFRKILKNHPDEEQLRSQWLEEIKFNDTLSVELAISRLSNDEHIVAAIGSDIISSAFVIAHNADNTNYELFCQHAIACRSVSDPDLVLESKFLESCLSGFEEILRLAGKSRIEDQPYILDIDLDYFNTRQSVTPVDSEKFRSLIEGALMVTIATEPEYVEGCSLEPGLTSEWLLDSLTKNFLKNLVRGNP